MISDNYLHFSAFENCGTTEDFLYVANGGFRDRVWPWMVSIGAYKTIHKWNHVVCFF